jgi:hypothetical protein
LPRVGQIDVLGTVDAAADKGETGAVEHHQADAGTIGQVFVGQWGARLSDFGNEKSVVHARQLTRLVCYHRSDDCLLTVASTLSASKNFGAALGPPRIPIKTCRFVS